MPQLFNIFIGDISFVGPRPLLKTFDNYPDYIKKRIYLSKPGLTGIGSIFFRDEELMLSLNNESPQNYYKRVIALTKENLNYGI